MMIIRRPIYYTLSGRPYFNRYGKNYLDNFDRKGYDVTAFVNIGYCNDFKVISLTDTVVTLEVF